MLLYIIVTTLTFTRTKLLIGQTFQPEFEQYVSGIGIPPAGSSHYGDIYTGTINQGTDGEGDTPFLAYIGQKYPNATAVVGISIKDDPAAGGYPTVKAAVHDIAYTTKWDGNIRKFARKFNQFPRMNFLVRLGYEVSIYMFGDTQAYKDCFNKMGRIIRDEEKANNTKFIFHPVRSLQDTQQMYPGDQFCDFIGFSVFNNDLSMATPSTPTVGLDSSRLDQNLKMALDWASQKKPIVIPESAYQSVPPGWINKIGTNNTDPFKEYLDRWYGLVRTYKPFAVSYINSNWPQHGWTGDWTDSRVEVHEKSYWESLVVDNPVFQQFL